MRTEVLNVTILDFDKRGHRRLKHNTHAMWLEWSIMFIADSFCVFLITRRKGQIPLI